MRYSSNGEDFCQPRSAALTGYEFDSHISHQHDPIVGTIVSAKVDREAVNKDGAVSSVG